MAADHDALLGSDREGLRLEGAVLEFMEHFELLDLLLELYLLVAFFMESVEDARPVVVFRLVDFLIAIAHHALSLVLVDLPLHQLLWDMPLLLQVVILGKLFGRFSLGSSGSSPSFIVRFIITSNFTLLFLFLQLGLSWCCKPRHRLVVPFSSLVCRSTHRSVGIIC